MTPQEALRVLDLAAGAALMTRMQHVKAQEAIQILTRALQNGPADEVEDAN